MRYCKPFIKCQIFRFDSACGQYTKVGVGHPNCLLSYLYQYMWSMTFCLWNQGRPKTPEEIPENVTVFSTGTVPNTNAGNYGSRLLSDPGRQMQIMEFKFHSGNRKKKLGNDLICY